MFLIESNWLQLLFQLLTTSQFSIQFLTNQKTLNKQVVDLQKLIRSLDDENDKLKIEVQNYKSNLERSTTSLSLREKELFEVRGRTHRFFIFSVHSIFFTLLTLYICYIEQERFKTNFYYYLIAKLGVDPGLWSQCKVNQFWNASFCILDEKNSTCSIR